MQVFSKSKLYMKISKSPALVSGVAENALKHCFFHTGMATLEANFLAVRHIRMWQNMFLKSEQTIVSEILKF